MSKITSVEPQKKNPKRFSIFLDGEFAFGADEDLVVDKRLVVAKFYAVGDKDYSTIRGARCYIEDFDFEEHTIPIKVVEIKEGWGARRGAVRHELYHLHKHMPLRKNPVAKFLRGFFYEEPTATLYAITGIKL